MSATPRAARHVGLGTTLLVPCMLAACAPDPASVRELPPGYGDRLAGRAFTVDGVHHTLADLRHLTLGLTFDVPAKLTTGHAELHFRPVETGVPFFLLTPSATAATLDGAPIQLAALRDPDDVATFTSVGIELDAGTDHVVVIDYPVASATYSATGVDFATRMLDVSRPPPLGTGAPANFFEAYGPSSIEGDPFRLSLELTLIGGSAAHQLFSNGIQTSITPSRWTVEFPDYFTSSSFFLHLTETPTVVERATYGGLEHDIPITVYSERADNVHETTVWLALLFEDLETSFGPYGHSAFTANLTSVGGMEHAGATFSAAAFLPHELCHSWFGRGVLPADGRSGWIDEAICTWHGGGYKPSPPAYARGATNLADYSIWELATPPADPHRDGAQLLSEIDGVLAAQGGLQPVLRSLYTEWHGRAITTEQFLAFLQARSPVPLTALFAKYVYGR